MLALDDPRWGELVHAYDVASDTPHLLRRLAADPDDADAWDKLWGSICHQGSVYSASHAAVPHLVALAEGFGPAARAQALGLVAAIAVGRLDPLPELAASYREALGKLEPIAVALLRSDADDTTARWAFAAIAVAHDCLQAAERLEYTDGDEQWMRCRNDDCAAEICAVVDGGVWKLDAAGAEPVTPATAGAASATAAAGTWSDETAPLHLAAIAERAGRSRLAGELRGLAGRSACPECGAPLDVWRAILIGDDL